MYDRDAEMKEGLKRNTNEGSNAGERQSWAKRRRYLATAL
jgi:hypothetical protein